MWSTIPDTGITTFADSIPVKSLAELEQSSISLGPMQFAFAEDDFGNYFYVDLGQASPEGFPVLFMDHDGGDVLSRGRNRSPHFDEMRDGLLSKVGVDKRGLSTLLTPDRRGMSLFPSLRKVPARTGPTPLVRPFLLDRG